MSKALSPDDDEPQINYTLSLAAVKSGYLDSMRGAGDSGGGNGGGGGGGGSGGGTLGGAVSVSVDSQGCEVSVEERQEGSKKQVKQRKQRDGTEERDNDDKTATNEAVTAEEEASSKHIVRDKYEVESHRSGWENISVSSKFRGAQKRISRLMKKARGKRKNAEVRSSESQSIRPPPYLTSYSGGVSSLGVSSRGASSEGCSSSSVKTTIVNGKKDTANQEDGEATIEVVVDKSIEPPVSPDVATTPKVDNLEAHRAVEPEPKRQEVRHSAVVPSDKIREKSTPALDELEKLRTESAVAKEEEIVLQKPTSDTISDDSSVSFEGYDRRLPEKPKFIISKVSNKTYIINQATSIVEPAWSNDEKTTEGGAFSCLTCGLCAVQEEWDVDDFDDEEEDDDDDEDEDEDETYEDRSGTSSEEGRVADAVITIQEHAKRLGLSEYELLQMINEE